MHGTKIESHRHHEAVSVKQAYHKEFRQFRSMNKAWTMSLRVWLSPRWALWCSPDQRRAENHCWQILHCQLLDCLQHNPSHRLTCTALHDYTVSCPLLESCNLSSHDQLQALLVRSQARLLRFHCWACCLQKRSRARAMAGPMHDNLSAGCREEGSCSPSNKHPVTSGSLQQFHPVSYDHNIVT